jgi:hypothetical protein
MCTDETKTETLERYHSALAQLATLLRATYLDARPHRLRAAGVAL